MFRIVNGILLPFLGTTLGAFAVFFVKDKINEKFQRALLGFSAGVMLAASIWSLIIPSVEQSASLNKFSFVPATVGIILGIGFLISTDNLAESLEKSSKKK